MTNAGLLNDTNEEYNNTITITVNNEIEVFAGIDANLIDFGMDIPL